MAAGHTASGVESDGGKHRRRQQCVSKEDSFTKSYRTTPTRGEINSRLPRLPPREPVSLCAQQFNSFILSNFVKLL